MRHTHQLVGSRRFTIAAGGADVVQEVHDEVQVDQLVVKALVVQFQQLRLFIAAPRGQVLTRRRPTTTAHAHTQEQISASCRAQVLLCVCVCAHSLVRSEQLHRLILMEVFGKVNGRPEQR